MSGAIPLLLYTPSWVGQGQILQLFIIIIIIFIFITPSLALFLHFSLSSEAINRKKFSKKTLINERIYC